MTDFKNQKIAIVIPCFKVIDQIEAVIAGLPKWIWRVYVVDDKCPQKTGAFVERKFNDDRLKVIYNKKNLGVGGAVIAGYRSAIEAGADVIVKIDGDGQMDISKIHLFVIPIVRSQCDYTKGNRFFDLSGINQMPKIRIFGNVGLSFITKFSSGYWNIFDPTNGYTAIDARVAAHLPLDKLSERYFFESDLLCQLGLARAVVRDIPIPARYGDEESSINIFKIFFEFPFKHSKNYMRRILIQYFLRDFSAASLELVLGILFLGFGLIFGISNWNVSSSAEQVSTPGTVMLAALPIILGIQLLLAFLNFDIGAQPSEPLKDKLFYPKELENEISPD